MVKKQFISVILARGGSKGIPMKNLTLVNGKPLIYWTIAASLASKYIFETFVSSDSDDIISYAKSQKVKTIKRPGKLAQDTTTSAESLVHAIDKILENYEPDYIVLLQPTSPLRTSNNIDESCFKILEEKTNCLISVCKVDNKYLKILFESENGFLTEFNNGNFTFKDRQSLPKTYLPNGSIYIVKLKNFIKTKRFLDDFTSKYLMTKKSSLDIDNFSDIIKANKEIKNLKM